MAIRGRLQLPTLEAGAYPTKKQTRLAASLPRLRGEASGVRSPAASRRPVACAGRFDQGFTGLAGWLLVGPASDSDGGRAGCADEVDGGMKRM